MARRKKKKPEAECTALIVVSRPALPAAPKRERRRAFDFRLAGKRRLFLKHYELRLGNVTLACQDAGIGRATFYRWMNSDREVNKRFRKRLNALSVQERKADLYEELFLEGAKSLMPSVLVHAAKTILAKRGFGDSSIDTESEQQAEAVRQIRGKIREIAKQKGISFDDELENVRREGYYRPEIIEAVAKKD